MINIPSFCFGPDLNTLDDKASLPITTFGLHQDHLYLAVLTIVIVELTQLNLHPTIGSALRNFTIKHRRGGGLGPWDPILRKPMTRT